MASYQVEIIPQSENHLGDGVCFALHFHYDDREICTVLLAPTKNDVYETHISDLPEDLLNKGWGIEIYKDVFTYCINNNIKLASSGSRCEDAERLWKSIRLNRMFEIIEDNDRYYLVGAKFDRKIAVT